MRHFNFLERVPIIVRGFKIEAREVTTGDISTKVLKTTFHNSILSPNQLQAFFVSFGHMVKYIQLRGYYSFSCTELERSLLFRRALN